MFYIYEQELENSYQKNRGWGERLKTKSLVVAGTAAAVGLNVAGAGTPAVAAGAVTGIVTIWRYLRGRGHP